MERAISQAARKAVAIASSAALAGTMVVAVPQAQADEIAADVVISTLKQLKDFRDDVNAGNDYAGAVVSLAKNLDLEHADWEPIGTAEHPFCGTFEGDADGDGKNAIIYNLTIDADDSSSTADIVDVGLFGYVGIGGQVRNLTLGGTLDDTSKPSCVTVNGSKVAVRNVGSIVGYAYGTPGEPALVNCVSDAEVSITSTLKQDADKMACFSPEGNCVDGTEGADQAAGWTTNGLVIENVGGVVGYCAAGIEGSTFTGAVSVTAHQDPLEETTALAEAVGGIAGRVGGFTSKQDIEDESKALCIVHYAQADGTYASETETVSEISGCINEGTLQTAIDGDGGLDRFGAQVFASARALGGVAGYVMANVEDCHNTGTINAVTATGTGGVIGEVRSSAYTGSSSMLFDAGEQYEVVKDGSNTTYNRTSTGPTLTVENCTNKASVTGLAQVGGIVGGAGTHTAITLCSNLPNGQKDQAITGTRWNKPSVGGIAGQSLGSVSYCHNHVDCITATGGGFYVAGLVGTLSRYLKTEFYAADSPMPELWACYSTGGALAEGSYKQGGICGENNGYIHDCYCVEGALGDYNEEATTENPYRPMVAVNLGTVGQTVQEVDGDAMQEKEFCGMLNATTTPSQYREGVNFLSDFATEDDQLNDGYPVLAQTRWAAEAADASLAKKTTLDAEGLAAAGTGTARFRADSNPMPELAITMNGTELVQGADFYALPDENVLVDGTCMDVADAAGKTFEAHLVGIGDYQTPNAETGSTFTAPYTLAKGNFSTCTATFTPRQYNFLDQTPSKSEAKVVDSTGEEVLQDEYEMVAWTGKWSGDTYVGQEYTDEMVDYHVTYASRAASDSGKKGDAKSHVGYQFKFTAKSNSNYEGEIYGYFQISKAELFSSEKTVFEGFSWGGQTWNWKRSQVVNGKQTDGYLYQVDADGNELKDADGNVIKGMSIVYTGEEIKPAALSLKYKDGNGDLHELEQGSDFRVVYGDPGRDNLIASDNDTVTNVAASDGQVGTRPCVTVRYVPGDSKNFANYQNFFFDIVAADISNSKQCTVTWPKSIGMGKISSIVVKGSTGAVIPAANYTVSFGAVSGGKVKVTLKGKGNLTGGVSKKITLAAQSAGSGTSLGSYLVTGASTATFVKSASKKKAVAVPATVKIAGKTYKVTAVGKAAAKGMKKVTKLTVGKNVAKIGAQAFMGCKKLKSITLSTTKLGKSAIGSKAFANLAAKPTAKVPASKLKAYKKLLKKAGLTSKAKVKK